MNPLHKKIKLLPNQIIVAINKPDRMEKALSPLPTGVKITTVKSVPCDHIYWFVKTAAEIEEQQVEVLKLLKPNMLLWVLHPKGTSKIQTDLTRDKGWDSLMAVKDLAWFAYISFDETWTASGVRRKTEADKKREAKPAEERLIFKYADSKTKTITLPADMVKALNANKKAMELFDKLAFSHRREYVEWVITAKREETRNARLQGTIDRLLAGLKNPADR
jgi:hypothetical protein